MVTIYLIAKTCHEVNRVYCESLGDHSQFPWDEAPEELRDSAIEGVTLRLKNPDMTAEESHAAWMQHRLDHGWSWGPEKDDDLKTHPCLVPYVELPTEQKTKDYLFKAVVDAMGGRR